MRPSLFICLFGLCSAAWAQDLPDSGLPDASVEGGSAQGTSEENDPQGGPCLESKDCSQGFACSAGRCVPVKPKSVGCSAAPGLMLGAAAVVGSLLRRRR